MLLLLRLVFAPSSCQTACTLLGFVHAIKSTLLHGSAGKRARQINLSIILAPEVSFRCICSPEGTSIKHSDTRLFSLRSQPSVILCRHLRMWKSLRLVIRGYRMLSFCLRIVAHATWHAWAPRTVPSAALASFCTL